MDTNSGQFIIPYRVKLSKNLGNIRCNTHNYLLNFFLFGMKSSAIGQYDSGMFLVLFVDGVSQGIMGGFHDDFAESGMGVYVVADVLRGKFKHL